MSLNLKQQIAKHAPIFKKKTKNINKLHNVKENTYSPLLYQTFQIYEDKHN